MESCGENRPAVVIVVEKTRGMQGKSEFVPCQMKVYKLSIINMYLRCALIATVHKSNVAITFSMSDEVAGMTSYQLQRKQRDIAGSRPNTSYVKPRQATCFASRRKDLRREGTVALALPYVRGKSINTPLSHLNSRSIFG